MTDLSKYYPDCKHTRTGRWLEAESGNVTSFIDMCSLCRKVTARWLVTYDAAALKRGERVEISRRQVMPLDPTRESSSPLRRWWRLIPWIRHSGS